MLGQKRNYWIPISLTGLINLRGANNMKIPSHLTKFSGIKTKRGKKKINHLKKIKMIRKYKYISDKNYKLTTFEDRAELWKSVNKFRNAQ